MDPSGYWLTNRRTRPIEAGAPRSISIHWVGRPPEFHKVAFKPSTARVGEEPASVADAVTGFPSAMFPAPGNRSARIGAQERAQPLIDERRRKRRRSTAAIARPVPNSVVSQLQCSQPSRP